MHKHTLIHTASALGIALPLSLAASLPAAAQSQLIDNFQSDGALLRIGNSNALFSPKGPPCQGA